MGANGSLLLDFAGIAKKVQIITCARSATCRIALITGARLNALTRAGAKGEFNRKEKKNELFLSLLWESGNLENMHMWVKVRELQIKSKVAFLGKNEIQNTEEI